ncbi:hypothetical protein MASR1M31_02550 [Porphyromonadaceae bacterium]
MKNRDFIITSLQDWDVEIGSTIKNTAIEISRNNRVLYINPPLDHATWIRRSKDESYIQRMDVVKGRRSYLRPVNNNMWIVDCPFMLFSIGKISNKWVFDFFNKWNNKKLASFTLKVIKELGFKSNIHLIDNDIYRSLYLKELLNPKVSVYYRRDYVVAFSYWKYHGLRLEPILCAKSDVVLANSLFFANELRVYNSNIYDIETGVNLELYDSNINYKVPYDVENVKRPIIGYVGAIYGSRLDIDLLYNLIEKRPELSYVFVGPEDETFINHPIHQLSNVYFLGSKKVEELPSYIASFDVCINPQVLNPITIGNYPLKIDEYLAMGKPIVATRTHTMEHIFKDYVHLADDIEGYSDLISKALLEVSDEQMRISRIQFAHTHSWENSVKKIYKAIEDFESSSC